MAQLDTTYFRQALSQFPTGVSVITTDRQGLSAAMTVSSFNSVSMDPPLILWSIKVESPSFHLFKEAGHFCVNILSAEQHQLAYHFSKPQADKFDGIDYSNHRLGCPVLNNCSAHLICRTWNQYEGGDHLIIVGEVIEANAEANEPLVFAGRDFFGLTPVATA